MERRYVGESDYPFGVLFKREHTEAVEVVHHSVATARTEDGPDFGVGEGCAEVGETLGMCAAEMSVFSKRVGIDYGLVAELAQYRGGRIYDATLYRAGGGDDGDFVAGTQGGRINGFGGFLGGRTEFHDNQDEGQDYDGDVDIEGGGSLFGHSSKRE